MLINSLGSFHLGIATLTLTILSDTSLYILKNNNYPSSLHYVAIRVVAADASFILVILQRDGFDCVKVFHLESHWSVEAVDAIAFEHEDIV